MCVVTSGREAGNLEFSMKIKSVHFGSVGKEVLYIQII